MTLAELLTGVLFIGHSLFGKTNPDMLADVLRTKVPEVQVDAQIINGAPLQWNWSHSSDAEGVDARTALPSGAFGAVILTEAIPLDAHLKWSATTENLLNFADLAWAARPDAQIFFQETWHSLKSGTGATVPHDDGAGTPWRERLAQDLPKWQGVVDAANAARPDSPPVRLIPAGQAMGQLADAIAEGTVPGLSDVSALFSDDIHLNDLGHYFVTMVQFAALTGEPPVGLPAQLTNRWGKPFDALAPDLARRLQEIAWEAVTATGGDPPASAQAPRPQPTPKVPTGPALPEARHTPPPLPAPAVPPPMGMGLAAVTDWSSQQPFLDVMKTARPWIGHMPGRWGGAEYEDLLRAGFLDDNGWPVEMPRELGSIGTLILTDLPETARSLAGRYVLRFEGDGIVEVGGRASNVRYGKNAVRFDFSPGPGSVDIRIQRTDRGRKGDYVRDITVVREDRLESFDNGAVFNPDWLAHMRGFKVLRFMDWMDTNDSALSQWSDRPRPEDVTWALKGVPVEVMIALANELRADAWFTLPHLATDDYFRRFAALARDGLAADSRAWVEFSNEVWNWQFAQARWADEMALARWGAQDAWVQFYALRAMQMADIWTEVYGVQADDRLVRIIATQTGWLGLEDTILNAPLVVAEGLPRPATRFDAYAVAGYFGSSMGNEDGVAHTRDWLAQSLAAAEANADRRGLTGTARSDFIEAHKFDAAMPLAARDLLDGSVIGRPDGTLVDVLTRMLPHHAQVAKSEGLDMIMYEGGTHLVGLGSVVEDEAITAFLTHVNYSPEMGTLYDRLIAGWAALGGGLFTHYADVYVPSKWGSWGALRTLSDDNPRWQALQRALQ